MKKAYKKQSNSARRVKSARSMAARKSNGYMMLICAGIVGATIFFGMACLCFYQLFISSGCLQSDADRLALIAALKLNENDCAGKINLLEQASRELIFDSRESFDSLHQDGKDPDALAEQLLEEAKENSHLVEQTRQAWISQTVDEMNKLAKKSSEGRLFSSAVNLPWSAAAEPQIEKIEFGNLHQTHANVELVQGSEQLHEFDIASGYADSRGKFYMGKKTLTLPSQDGSLSFHFSCLPPPIQGETAEARLAQASAFQPAATVIENGSVVAGRPSDIACAVRVSLQMEVVGRIGKGLQATEHATAVAATRGADRPID
jgi:hypothetical protein